MRKFEFVAKTQYFYPNFTRQSTIDIIQNTEFPPPSSPRHVRLKYFDTKWRFMQFNQF